MSWDQHFFDPIELPSRKKPLVTLRDAAQYILKLPVAERDADESSHTSARTVVVLSRTICAV
ncbi:MAG: hypothetical protein ACRECG_12615 [Bradyrhizobium sp.]